MIEKKFILYSIFFTLVISLTSVVFQYFEIPYLFYVWEIAVDFRIVALFGFLFFLYKKKNFNISFDLIKIHSWNWKINFELFFTPIFIYLVIIGIGYVVKLLIPNQVENELTSVLAALFDIPAIYVFSITTILLEEIFFRSVLLNSLSEIQSQSRAVIISSLIWGFFSLTDNINFEQVGLENFILVFISKFSIGVFCSFLYLRYSSLWAGYSFRIGLMLASSLSVSSIVIDSDPFFTTESTFFVAEGWIFSAILLLIAFLVVKRSVPPKLVVERPDF